MVRGRRGYSPAVFFAVSKALAAAADPVTWAAALLLAGLVVLRWSRRWAAVLVALAAVALTAFSSPVVASALRRTMERSAPSTFRPDHRYDAVVVLGGGDARVEGGASIVRRGGARGFFYTGALGEPGREHLLRQLTARGLSRQDVLIGTRARNTYENALETSDAMAQRGWRSIVVVTSALHAPRALACFRRLGLAPDLFPVELGVPPLGRRAWLPSEAGLAQSREVLHELVGRLAYQVVGYAS